MKTTKLTNLAIKIYSEGAAQIHIDRFVEATKQHPVVDKRKEGHYCSECGRFSKTPQMGWGVKVIYHWNRTGVHSIDGLWIINSHYDGCRGWD